MIAIPGVFLNLRCISEIDYIKNTLGARPHRSFAGYYLIMSIRMIFLCLRIMRQSVDFDPYYMSNEVTLEETGGEKHKNEKFG